MIKKVSIYFSIFIGFLFCFLFSENINILAYKSSTIDNVFGSYPIQMDIENYDRINILNNIDIESGTNCGVTYSFNNSNNEFTLNGTVTSNNCTIVEFFNLNSNDLKYVTLNFYYISGTVFNNNYESTTNEYNFRVYFHEINWNGNALYVTKFNNNYNINGFSELNNFIDDSTYSINFHTGFNTSNKVVFNNYKFKIMLTNNANEYVANDQTYYSSPFIFGYRVDLCANSSSSFSANVTFNASNSNYNFSRSGSFSVSANSTSCVGDIVGQNVISFNIDSNGYISLENTTFNVLFTNKSGTLNNGYYLQLTPILNAYYKGNYTTNLYSINRYTYNNLIVNGVNLESNNSSIGYITTINAVTFNYGISDLKNPINVIYYNNVSEVFQNNVIPINQYISTGFIIGLNSSNISTLNNSNLIFSFSGISTYISGQLATNSPLPENELTISKYNSCSAWYDIPCQLGNAITYVVYEAPIISPVLTFIVSFVTMFSSLVSFVDLFRSFGIVFGCFIIYMFIELLHKYSK